MNKHKINNLIKHLEQLPDDHFDMKYFAKKADCDTVCCIAGYTCMLEGLEFHFDHLCYSTNETVTGQGNQFIPPVAGEILGLNKTQQDWLFYGHFHEEGLKKVTKEQAIEALKHLLAGKELEVLFQ